jgi:hypothetical protein
LIILLSLEFKSAGNTRFFCPVYERPLAKVALRENLTTVRQRELNAYVAILMQLQRMRDIRRKPGVHEIT